MTRARWKTYSKWRGPLTPEELGLNLAEARQILHDVQQSMVTSQVAEYIQGQRQCPRCSVRRSQKGRHEIVFRTLFGKLRLDSMRLHHCDCDPGQPTRTFSPLAELLKERTSPELLYLEAKWSSLLSFGVSCDLLGEVLPIGDELNTTTLRNNLHYVAERMEKELGEERESFLPETVSSQAEELPIPPGKPAFTLGLDGAYVHAGGCAGWFEVIVGKSVSAAGDGKYFGFVHNIDEKPKRRLYEVLRSQGLEPDQPVQFLSDGEETVRNPADVHQSAIGALAGLVPHHDAADGDGADEEGPERCGVSQFGRAGRTGFGKPEVAPVERQRRDGPASDDGLKQLLAGDEISAERQKLLKAVRDFGTYIATNQAFIPDYGDRHRNHETISTAFTESAVNQLVSKRMVKQQQMHWSQRGAHLLLQVRAQVLNNELRETFRCWHPGMRGETDTAVKLAA